MAAESPTKWQAQAYRFGVRRLESAVSDGDALLRGDRVRRRLNLSIIVSIIIAALALGGFAVYGFINPAPTIGDASVVIDSDTGGVYVSRDGRLYPAMNLSSALLAAGRGQSGDSPPSRTTVDSDAIGTEPRGPMLGIPGAPNVLPSQSALVRPKWTVCDEATVSSALPPNSPPKLTTTALLGNHVPHVGALGTTGALVVTPDGGTTTYLVWDGLRSKIDLSDHTIRQAFSLGSAVTPRPISTALLNLIPAAPDFVVPPVSGVGTQPSWATALGVRIGDVFALKRSDGTRAVFVALSNGVEPITPLIGDLIRAQFDVTKPVPLVSPIALRKAPQADSIDVSRYPPRAPTIVGLSPYNVACVYRSANHDVAQVFALKRVPVPGHGKPVTVTRPGPSTVDAVYLRPGKGAVLTTATAGQDSGARALYVVTDDGVAYPVVDPLALSYLGLNVKPSNSAPELINLLPKGPTLDPDTAVHFYPETGSSASGLPAPTSSSAGPGS
ncbi:MAG TPA: type VII secretion protein EccB [Jatrophihabitantaceae bacterium]|jgi:type VII secretion protein EccB